jgi:hypothetical protein
VITITRETTTKRALAQTETQEPAQDKLFTDKLSMITMMQIKGGRAPDELTGPNKEKKQAAIESKREKNIAKEIKLVRDTEQKGWS